MDFIPALSKLLRYLFLCCTPFLLFGCAAQSLSPAEGSSSIQNQAQLVSPLELGSMEDGNSALSGPTVGFSMSSMPGLYPITLEGFLERTSLIVIAELGEVEYRKLYGYDSETSELSEPTEKELEMDVGGIDVADFTLKVEEVLWAEETIITDEPVILRVLWDSDPEWEASMESAGFKNYVTGDRYLFMLNMNPDSTYGVGYDEHRLEVDEQGVLYYSQMAPPYPIKHGPFTEGERYGEAAGPPLTVDDLVRAAEGKE